MRRRVFLGSALALGLTGCRGGGSEERTPTATTSTSSATGPSATASRTSTSAPTSTPAATPTPSTSAAPRDQPAGFPLDPSFKTGRVVGEVGSRTIAWGQGATVAEYSRNDQPSNDPVRANACGWNARVHVEYEGQPAIDWYIPTGTPIYATMDGTATLLVNTVSNPFQAYGVSREPYIGNPDRRRAPIVPFSGPGGGQGVFVRIESPTFRSDYAHMDLALVWPWLPADAFLSGYSKATDAVAQFAAIRDFRTATAVARWAVKRGDVIGFSGDSGYSEAPHLHYAIRRLESADLLCPTLEPGFEDAGWLFK